MDGEAFFDRLYSRYYIHFPCFALYRMGEGFATEPADDGSNTLVLITDDDLVRRYHVARNAAEHVPVPMPNADWLARFLDRLPPDFTHVTFDPSPNVHRRFPLDVVRDSLPEPVSNEDAG